MSSIITEEKTYDLRFTTTADGEVVKKWLQDTSVQRWYPPSAEVDIESFVRNWIGFSRYRASLTATYNEEMIGVSTIFLMPYIKVAHLCMMYLIVDPKYQRRGVGNSLIRNIKHLAKNRFKLESMHCEVWEGCPLIGLLKKNGFKEILRQENFVKLDDGLRSRIVLESKL